jgi:L-threonylcarbamoyladenylate synthase
MPAEIGKDVKKAMHYLLEGNVIGLPTETVYGLAGNGYNAEVVAKIFAIKNRPFFDPLILHIGDFSQIYHLTSSLPEILADLARSFWPGPLTILVPKGALIPDLVTSGLPRVGIRMPDHPLSLNLLKSIPFPIAAPSANPFGYISPTRPEHVFKQLGTKIPYILDGGNCKVGLESTIVGWEEEVLVIYRLGGLSISQIKARYHGKIRINESTSHPQAPGMTLSHYAPGKPLFLGDKKSLLSVGNHEKAAVLCFREKWTELEENRQWVLSASADFEEAAYKLFAFLREMDEADITHILAEKLPDEGLGIAINDRLTRASKK